MVDHTFCKNQPLFAEVCNLIGPTGPGKESVPRPQIRIIWPLIEN